MSDARLLHIESLKYSQNVKSLPGPWGEDVIAGLQAVNGSLLQSVLFQVIKNHRLFEPVVSYTYHIFNTYLRLLRSIINSTTATIANARMITSEMLEKSVMVMAPSSS